MMWRALDSVMRKLNTFWNEVEEFGQTMRGVLFDRLRRQDKLQTTTDESCERSEDSGFADDEGLHCLSSDYIPNSRPTESDVQSGDSEANDNDFVLDSDIKNQQRITLMSLLYSRALERKLNAIRARKPSYSLNKKEHVRKHK